MAVAEQDPRQGLESVVPDDGPADDQIEPRVWFGIEFVVDLAPNSRLLTVCPQMADGRHRASLDPRRLLDSSAEVPDLPVPISGEEREVLETLRRYHPLVHRTKGFVVSHPDVPELLAFLRTKACVSESPRTAATPVHTEPLQPVLWIDYDEEGALEVLGEFRLPGRGVRLGAGEVVGREGWIAIGDGLYRAPGRLPPGSGRFFTGRPVRLTDQEIPRFLHEELPRLAEKLHVDASPRVSESRVVDVAGQARIELRLDSQDRLVADVFHQYGDLKIGHAVVAGQSGQKPYVRLGDDWVRVDPQAVAQVEKQLTGAGLTRAEDGSFGCPPDEVPAFLTRQLPQIERTWNVYVPEALRGARVVAMPFKTKVTVDLDDQRGWLWFDIRYEVGDVTVRYHDVQALPKGRQYLRVGRDWIKVDRRAHREVRDRLRGQELEETRRGFGGPGRRFRELTHLFSRLGTLEHTAAYEAFLKRLASFEQIGEQEPPQHLRAVLRPYQRHGYNWLAFLYQYGLNGVLADDMGLGKTVQTLAHLAWLREKEGPAPSLVVCPTSVVGNWRQEAWKFTPRLRVMSYTGAKRERLLRYVGLCDLVITSYSMVWRDLEALRQVPWRHVILDEAQYIKNQDTKVARACKLLEARSKLAVTGTPVENRLSELWSIFDFLMPGYLGSYADFRDRYEVPIMRAGRHDLAQALADRVRPFVLRRLKEQVAQDLPEKVEQDQPCALTDEQVGLYREIAGRESQRVLDEVDRKGLEQSRVTILAAITKLKQVCDHPALVTGDPAAIRERSGKFEAFAERLAEILDAGDKVLVFSQFTGMLEIIRRHLQKEHIGHLYLHGGVRQRDPLVEQFQTDPACRVFLLSLHAAGVGLNLTAANRVIHYDRWWNPAVENQATDRAHRLGQKRTVFVYKMLTEGTIEEKIHRLQEEKARLFDSVISADEALVKHITRDELLNLFRLDPARWTADG